MLTSALMRLTEAFTFVPVILSSTPFLLYPNENIIFVAKVIYSQHLELKQYGKLKRSNSSPEIPTPIHKTS